MTMRLLLLMLRLLLSWSELTGSMRYIALMVMCLILVPHLSGARRNGEERQVSELDHEHHEKIDLPTKSQGSSGGFSSQISEYESTILK